MPVSRSALVCRGALVAAVAAGIGAGTTDRVDAAEPAGDAVQSRTMFSFTDRRITESSGLVDGGGTVFTVNDSGDGPLVYAVDVTTGDTTAVTTYSEDEVTDVEAMAPGRGGSVWVGDIGDNDLERRAVDLYRLVPSREGDREVDGVRFGLVYPDSPHDAETLLLHPRTGRVYVVTKAVTGGTVYAGPDTLTAGAENRLEEVARVPGLVTDGSFFPDGEHVLLRSLGGATVYTFPDFRPVGQLGLPAQEQGEAVAIGRSGRISISTEGAYSDVLQIALPPVLVRRLGDDAVADTELPTASAAPSPAQEPTNPTSDPLSTGDGDGVWLAGAALLLTFAGWLLFTVSRRRSPRRR
jgi:hypothetical protein